ncbi:MAG: hypothetical protein AB8I08_33610 [Sandaracinaceae bacterium]
MSERARRAADQATEAVSSIPPLAWMGLICALTELLLARIAWHGLTDLVDPDTLRVMRRFARLPRTLAAVASVVSLLTSLMTFLRVPGWASIPRRLAIAAFSGIFLPAIVVATVMPAESMRPRMVVFALAAANVIVTLMGMTAARYRPGPAIRIAMMSVTLTSFLALAVVGLGQLSVAGHNGSLGGIGALFAANPSTTQRTLMAMRHLGEVAWLSVPVAAAVAVVMHAASEDRRRRLTMVVGVSLLCMAATLAFQSTVGHRYRLVLFGAARLGLFGDDAPALYALPLGVGAAGALVALAQRKTALVPLGIGVLFWMAGGYAPHTPIQLIYIVMAAAMLGRAAQALDPSGAWRRNQPWARLIGRR